MTYYVAVYDDSEYDAELPATRAVVAVHRRLGVPATFCLHTKPLEDDPELARVYKELLADPADDGLFEVLPHSHTHAVLVDHANLGAGLGRNELEFEIDHSKHLIESIFEKPAVGFRSTNGYFGGWRGRTHLLELMRGRGFEFCSSFVMGPGDTVPAPLTQPYYYAEDGFRQLLEIPGHDWHDNVLQGWPPFPAAWPPCVPAGLPNRPPETPREKFEIYRANVDWAAENKLDFYSPALHPVSIHRFEPEATWVEMLVGHAVAIGMKPVTMTAFANVWRAANPPAAMPG